MRNVVLFSGGLDSLCTLLCLQQAEPIPLFVDLGVTYSRAERRAARGICGELRLPLNVSSHWTVGILEEPLTAHVPYRNMLLATLALAHLEAHRQISPEEDVVLYMSGLRDDRAADSTPEAYALIEAALQLQRAGGVSVRSMWHRYAKVEMVSEILGARGDGFVALARRAYSCYQATRCGLCSACVRYYVALMANGIECEDLFPVCPASSPRSREMLRSMRDRPHEYDLARILSSTAVLGGS